MHKIISICVLGVIISSSVHPTSADSLSKLRVQHFKKWCARHERTYEDQFERVKRLKTFSSNIQLIEELNKKYLSDGIVFKENLFADLTPEEFAATHLMPKQNPVNFPLPKKKQNLFGQDFSLPNSFDWKERGLVGEVRDQGSAGTCWAFSAVQNIEGQWAKKSKNLMELSVEQIVDCDGSEDQTRKKADCGVFGGWPYLAYEYVKSVGGIESEIDYPYCCGLGGDKGTCYVCPAPGYNKTLCGPPAEYCKQADSCGAKIDHSKFVKGLKIKDWSWFGQNETEIAQHLMEEGPLSVAINAATLQFYHAGVYDPILCDPKALDHAVLITGFGNEKTIFGASRPYWNVKNSWGKKWGQNGYFRIARGKNTCGISTQVTTAHLD